MFGFGSSPILDHGRVYLLWDSAEKSWLHCIDTASGDDVWETSRGEKGSSYATPYVWQQEQRRELVIAGSGSLDGYDIHTGEQLWTVGGLPSFICTSPVATKDLLIFGGWTTAHVTGAKRTQSGFDESLKLTDEEAVKSSAFIKRFDRNGNHQVERTELPESRTRKAFRFIDVDDSGSWEVDELDTHLSRDAFPRRNVMVAVRPGGRGDITQSHVAWETTKNLPSVAAPVIHDGRVHFIKKGGFLTTLELATGNLVSVSRLGGPGEYYATPLIIGDRLLILSQRGGLFLADASDPKLILVTHDVGESISATPAVVDGRLYLRTGSHLICFSLTD